MGQYSRFLIETVVISLAQLWGHGLLWFHHVRHGIVQKLGMPQNYYLDGNMTIKPWDFELSRNWMNGLEPINFGAKPCEHRACGLGAHKTPCWRKWSITLKWELKKGKLLRFTRGFTLKIIFRHISKNHIYIYIYIISWYQFFQLSVNRYTLVPIKIP